MMPGRSVPAHKQTNPAHKPGQQVDIPWHKRMTDGEGNYLPEPNCAAVKRSRLATKVAESQVWGHFPMGATTGRTSCAGSLEANDPKPAALARRPVPVFAASLPDDEVGEL